MVENFLKILFLCAALAEARVTHKIDSENEHELSHKKLPYISHQSPLLSGGHLPTQSQPLFGGPPLSLHSPSNGNPLVPLAFREPQPDEMSLPREPHHLSPSLSDQSSQRLRKSTSTTDGTQQPCGTNCTSSTTDGGQQPCDKTSTNCTSSTTDGGQQPCDKTSTNCTTSTSGTPCSSKPQTSCTGPSPPKPPAPKPPASKPPAPKPPAPKPPAPKPPLPKKCDGTSPSSLCSPSTSTASSSSGSKTIAPTPTSSSSTSKVAPTSTSKASTQSVTTTPTGTTSSTSSSSSSSSSSLTPSNTVVPMLFDDMKHSEPVLNKEIDLKQLEVYILSFVINGSEAEFLSRVTEFEYLIGDSLYTAVEKHILLYYSAMVAAIQKETGETIKVTVSVSTIMNESASLKQESADKTAIYVSSLLMHDKAYFSLRGFIIKSISIVETGRGSTFIASKKSSTGQLSGSALSAVVILGLIATIMTISVVLMVVYIRYSVNRNYQNKEKIPLIPNDQSRKKYQQVNQSIIEV